jgi:hypothetical protein
VRPALADDVEGAAAVEIAAGASVATLVAFPPEQACSVAAVKIAAMDSKVILRMACVKGLSTTDDMALS